MKRFLTTIVCVFCVLTASAVSYGASYKGSNYSGRIYTTSSARSTSIGSGGVMASTPFASMGSISYGSRATRMSPVGTTNVAMVGGVVTGAYPKNPISLRVDPGGDADECPFCIDHVNNDNPDDPTPDGRCDICWCEMDDLDENGHCSGCSEEYGYCRCPIGDGWQVWLFMAVMAFAYAAFKKRKASL